MSRLMTRINLNGRPLSRPSRQVDKSPSSKKWFRKVVIADIGTQADTNRHERSIDFNGQATVGIDTEAAVTVGARPTFTLELYGPNDAGGISPGSVLYLSSPFICPLCVKLVTKSTVKKARQHKAREHYTKWHTWLSFPPGAEFDHLRMQIPQEVIRDPRGFVSKTQIFLAPGSMLKIPPAMNENNSRE
jgi:hypothetical protein